MPNTFTKLVSTTITSSGTNISISNIPQTFTDLHVLISARTDFASTVGTLAFWFNNDGSNLNSFTQLYGNGTTAASGRGSATFPSAVGVVNAASSAANIYTSVSIYIANYRTSNFKTALVDISQENNISTANNYMTSVLYRSTSPVTVLSLNGQQNTQGFLAGTTVTIYGINNTF